MTQRFRRCSSDKIRNVSTENDSSTPFAQTREQGLGP